MFKLFVSYNCGGSYQLDMEKETMLELEPRMKQCDEQWLRWYVDDENGESVPVVCKIHGQIMTDIAALR